ncbi:MAG: ferredoxin--NADP reductase [Chloroflexi bacterium]|nr:ferredoxin--NADP reductase [Chloroflexota bacterium]
MTTARRTRIRPKLAETHILERRELTPDHWLMWIEKPDGFTFKPGQYCTIGAEGIERAYSIASAPHEDRIELFIELVPYEEGGHLTPLLYALQTGDKLTIRPRAKGIFLFNPNFKNHLLVATVTGVVPYISFIRDYLHKGETGHRFFVLEGASYDDEFGYDDELSRYAAEYPDIVTFIPTVSRPNEERNSNWQGEKGRVNAIVEEQVERLGLNTDDTLIYACGHPGMIEDVKTRLIPKGFTVDEERFWKED